MNDKVLYYPLRLEYSIGYSANIGFRDIALLRSTHFAEDLRLSLLKLEARILQELTSGNLKGNYDPDYT